MIIVVLLLVLVLAAMAYVRFTPVDATSGVGRPDTQPVGDYPSEGGFYAVREASSVGRAALEAAILAPRPRFAMSGLTKLMDPGQGWGTGVHPQAIVSSEAALGAEVSVGPFSIVEAGAKIGAGTVIGPQCYVGADVVIGDEGYLREGVKIGARVKIGDRFMAQPGATIGGDGFSYVTPEKSTVEEARSTLGDQGEAEAHPWTRIL